MSDHNSYISSEVVQMLVSSLTQQGKSPVDEISIERFLNALARAQSGVPTGVRIEPDQASK